MSTEPKAEKMRTKRSSRTLTKQGERLREAETVEAALTRGLAEAASSPPEKAQESDPSAVDRDAGFVGDRTAETSFQDAVIELAQGAEVVPTKSRAEAPSVGFRPEVTLHDGAHLRFASEVLNGRAVERLVPAVAVPGGLPEGNAKDALTVRTDETTLQVATITTSAPSLVDFDACCSAIRSRLRGVEQYLVGELLGISDMIEDAERLFDPATPVEIPPGSRSGKFAHAMAKQLGRTAPWVEKVQQFSKLDRETRTLAEAQPDGSLRMLMDLAAEPDVANRVQALKTRSTQEGRKPSMKKLLAANAVRKQGLAESVAADTGTFAVAAPESCATDEVVASLPESAPDETPDDVDAALGTPANEQPSVAATAVDAGAAPPQAPPVDEAPALWLPRDGTVVAGLRVVEVNDTHVVVQPCRTEPTRNTSGPGNPRTTPRVTAPSGTTKARRSTRTEALSSMTTSSSGTAAPSPAPEGREEPPGARLSGVVSVPVDQVLLGSCEDVLRGLPDACFDAVVCDPPYGLGRRQPTPRDIERYLGGEPLDTGGDFAGKAWQIPSVPTWRECYRVLKPGGYIVACASTRTWDIMLIGIRAAGFDASDTVASRFGTFCLQWLHGQGFPKSTNISKALRKKAERAPKLAERLLTLATLYEGYGSALKPAWEPILCLRKPLDEHPAAGRPALPELDAPFFYTAKASTKERTIGGQVPSTHPTVKPLALMRWLLKLVVPEGGIALDPFGGSGTTALATIGEGRHYVLIERDSTYHAEAVARIAAARSAPWLFDAKVKKRADPKRQAVVR